MLLTPDHLIRPDALTRAEPLEWSTGLGTDVWAMYVAAMTGDLATLRTLLTKDPTLVRGAWGYKAPMVFAVLANQVEAARLLLDHGADPLNAGAADNLLDMARDRGYTEMIGLIEETLVTKHHFHPQAAEVAAAIRAADRNQVRTLLDTAPHLVHATDLNGNQPIHWATMTRQPEIIDELLRRGANIEAERFDHARPIHLFHGDYHFRAWGLKAPLTGEQIIAHLRSRGAVCDLNTACHLGDLDRVREILREDPAAINRVTYHTYYLGSGTPLHNAASKGHLEIVTLLLAHGADPNLREEHIAPHGRALYAAVYNDHYEIAKLLLENGASPNQPVESSADPLTFARERAERDKSKQNMVDLLCSYGAAQSLDILSYYGDVRTAAAIFHRNPELANNPDLLNNAADNGHEPFVRLLLHHHPDLPARTGVAAKTPELTKFLFERGMNPSHADWLRVTPLHRFAESGDVANATLFLDHGADMEARDALDQSRPLGWAAKYGTAAMVRLLLKRGAAVEHPEDPDWAAPLAWARRRGHAEIVAMLEQVAASGSLPDPSLAPYEAAVDDLVRAHNTGDADALERLTAFFQPPVPLTQAMLQAGARQRLGRAADSTEPIEPDQVRDFVARHAGYGSWDELVRAHSA